MANKEALKNLDKWDNELSFKESMETGQKESLGAQGSNESFEPSFMDKLAPNILAGLANFGHGIVNSPHNLINLISPQAASYIPKQDEYDFSSMLKLPGTTGDKLVQGLTEGIPSILMPSAKLGKAGEVISKVPGAGKYISDALGRIIPQVGLGAATNENPIEGAKNMGEAQLIGEILPAGGRAVKGIGELLNPEKFSRDLTKNIEKYYKEAKNKAGKYFEDVKGKHGFDEIYDAKNTTRKIGHGVESENYLSLDKKVINKYFPSKVKKLHEDFIKDPTLNKAHKLERELGYMSSFYKRNYSKKDPLYDEMARSMDHARNRLSKDIKVFLGKENKDSLKKWEKGKEIYKNEVVPFEGTSPIMNAANGSRKPFSKKEALNALENINYKKINNKNVVPEGHYLQKAFQDLQNKSERGELLQNLMPPLLKQISPNVLGIVQSPYLERKSPYYHTLKNAIIASRSNDMD